MKTIIKLNGYKAEVEWSGSKYYPQVNYLRNGDPGYPEEGGFEGIDAVWMALQDKNGNDILVDVYRFFTEEEILEKLIPELEEHEREYYRL